jgi:hypothetical protein
MDCRCGREAPQWRPYSVSSGVKGAPLSWPFFHACAQEVHATDQRSARTALYGTAVAREYGLKTVSANQAPYTGVSVGAAPAGVLKRARARATRARQGTVSRGPEAVPVACEAVVPVVSG